MQQFFAATGMRTTTAEVEWGLSRTTATDVLTLLERFTHSGLLSPAHRDELLRLMRSVDPGQRWGVSAGAPAGVSVALKNGWYPVNGVWRVNSTGYVSGDGLDYALVVLSDGHRSEESGIDVVERVARAVHAGLAETQD